MRSLRTFLIAGVLVASMAACGPFDGDNSSTTNSTAAANAPSASADPAWITVPAIPKGKITSNEALCKLIPVDKAAEVLGQPTVITDPWTSQLDPDVIGACNVFRIDDKGTADPADDTTAFAINVFVRSGAVEIVKKARAFLVNGGDKVSEYTISG